MTEDPEILELAENDACDLDAGELSRGTDLVQDDLVAISKIHSLESVSFIGGDFQTYEPLSHLPKLSKLEINYWSNSDLSSVGAITQLKELNLAANQEYKEISFLERLLKLEILDLTDGQFSDLTPVSSLPNLRMLKLTNCDEIKNFLPLAKLTSLEELHLESTRISELSCISGLTNLRVLKLTYCDETKDFSPLAKLTSLEELHLGHTSISELSCVSHLTNLKCLDITSTQVIDLAPLAGLEISDNLWLDIEKKYKNHPDDAA